MKTSNILSALILAGVSSAQTPAGFTPAVTQKLEVTFGTKSIETPGQPMAKTDTSRQPTIGLSGNATGTYIWMLIGESRHQTCFPPEKKMTLTNNLLIDLDAYEPLNP
jgi:hypothetical protein